MNLEAKIIECLDIHKNKISVPAGKLKFRPAVYGVIIRNNKILLSKQWDGYDFPGGGIDISETVEEALEREVFEETGYKAKAKELVYVGQAFHKSAFGEKHYNSIFIYYFCKIIGGSLSIKNIVEHEKSYIKGAEWVDINKTSKLKYYNNVNSMKIIKKAIKIGK